MTAPADIRRRLDRLESGPMRTRDIKEYSDEELIGIMGLTPYWADLTRSQRDRLIDRIARLAEEGTITDPMNDEDYAAIVRRIVAEEIAA